MCRAFRLAFDDSLHIEVYVAQVRRWFVMDFVCAGLYSFYAYSYGSEILLYVLSITLAFFYCIDGLSLTYVTLPERVYNLPRWAFQLNTTFNVITLFVNIAYTTSSIIQGSHNSISIGTAVFLTFYKACKCYALHKLSVRVITERPTVLAINEPLLV